MEYKLRGGSDAFKVTVVYTRCSHLERLELWEDLEEIASNTHNPWLFCGDFNVIMDDSEKLGSLLVTQHETLIFLNV